MIRHAKKSKKAIIAIRKIQILIISSMYISPLNSKLNAFRDPLKAATVA